MRVILAKTAGFCYGVERAVSLAHETAKAHGGAMLGSVIHNANVVAELEREGMRLIASPEEAAAGEASYSRFQMPSRPWSRAANSAAGMDRSRARMAR